MKYLCHNSLYNITVKDVFMRFKIEFESVDGESFLVPYNYNHIIASVIYESIFRFDPNSNLHDSTSFKYFTFSQLLFSKFKTIKSGIIAKDGKFSLQISSPNNDLLKQIMQGFLKEPIIGLMDIKLKITDIKIVNNPTFTEKMEFKTLSPIIANSRRKIDGINKEWDLAPSESEFYLFVEKNLVKKYNMYYGTDYDVNLIKISSNLRNVKRKRIAFKQGESKQHHIGYLMDVVLEGDPNVIKFAYDCGLSNKNSMGFGMLELAKY